MATIEDVARGAGVKPEEIVTFGEYPDGWLVITNSGERIEQVEPKSEPRKRAPAKKPAKKAS